MQCEVYILLFQIMVFGFKNVKAIIGYNVRPAEENEYPSVGCIARYEPEEEWQNKIACTGTLISNMFFLTAEHCFVDGDEIKYEVSLGAYVLECGIRYNPIWWMSYEQWSTTQGVPVSNILNDIMLIKIFGILGPTVIAATLGFVEDPSIFYGMNVEMVGIGRISTQRMPEVLHTTSVKVIGVRDCISRASQLQRSRVPITDRYFCSIGVPQSYIDIGDSGGPLYYYGVVVGINIAVCPIMDGKYHDGQLNLHVNLYHYKNFINSLVENHSR